jgi:hypothetical protein
MRPLSGTDIVRIWEVGQGRSPLEQAAAILAAAYPDVPAGELAALSIGQRDARLLALRRATFGSRLDGFSACPSCREPLEFALSASELGALLPAGDSTVPDAAGTYTLTVHGYRLRFRLPTGDDLAAAGACADTATARSVLVGRLILDARTEGRAAPAGALPAEVVDTLAARLAECDPLAEVVLDLDCPACGHRWQALFDIASYFWTELGVQSRRLLREVHTLASAYGWSESAILSLGGRRRQAYLELVGA